MQSKTKQFLKDLAKEYHKNGFNIKLAYKTLRPKVKDNTAKVEGSKALTNPNFVKELKELEKKSQLRYGIDMEKLVLRLKDLAYDEDKNASLKAVDMLIKVAGEYAPTKTDNKTTLEIQNPQEALNKLNNSLDSL